MRYWVCPTADHSLTCPGTWWQTAHLHCTPEGEERRGGGRGGEEREGRRGRGEGKKGEREGDMVTGEIRHPRDVKLCRA